MIESIVLKLALVPPEPQVPEGSKDAAVVFHPGRNYYKLRLLLWVVSNIGAFMWMLAFLGAATFAKASHILHEIWLGVAWLIVLAFFTVLPFTFSMQRLNYRMRWYIVTDRSLRIRTGILRVQELTMTFANIQEIRVSVNPLQKLLGLASVDVHSAGGGSEKHGDSDSHVARFDSVDNASAIRDLMLERLRVYRDSGLGHKLEGGESETASSASSDALEALNVLHEARALRAALKRS